MYPRKFEWIGWRNLGFNSPLRTTTLIVEWSAPEAGIIVECSNQGVYKVGDPYPHDHEGPYWVELSLDGEE